MIRPDDRLTRFFGRETELATVADGVANHRLVVVTGLGGMGKTRLAREFQRRHDGAVHFVDLRPLAGSTGLIESIAAALDVELRDSSDPIAAIAASVDCESVLILDNFEHLSETDAAAHVTALLSRAPMLRALVTSRVRMRVAGEYVIALGPLSAALDMLVDRARSADPSWSVAPSDRRLQALVRALDAIPLAIELAAAQLDIFGIDDLLTIVRSGARTGASSERSGAPIDPVLVAILDSSYGRLSASAQQVYRSLSVTMPGATFGALVAAAGGAPANAVRELLDHQLITKVGGHTPRFEWLDTIATFAGQKTSSAERLARRRDHVRAFASQARMAQDRGDPLSALVEDRDNLRVAIENALAEPSTHEDDRDSLLLAASQIYTTYGPFAELDRIVTIALADGNEGFPLFVRARLRTLQGRLREAEQDLDLAQDSLANSTLEVHALALARARVLRARLRGQRGEKRQATEELEGAIASLIAMDGPAANRELGRAKSAFGSHLHEAGERARARRELQEALDIHRRVGDRAFEGIALNHLGLSDLESGSLRDAEERLEGARQIHREVGNRRFEAIATGDLGACLLLLGRWDDALELLELAHERLSTIGDWPVAGLVASHLAVGLAEAARPDAAKDWLDRAHAELQGHGPAAMNQRCLRLAAVQLDLCAARRSRVAGDANRSGAAAALADLAAIESAADEAGDEVRLALRLARASRERYQAHHQGWLVDRGGGWFAPPFGERVEIHHRPQLARVLAALAATRTESDEGLEPAQLAARAWPGERLIEESALNRVRVAVSTLRKLGLRDVLITEGRCYRLTADVLVVDAT